MKIFKGVTITKGPKDWQIIQRDEKGYANIEIEGYYETDAKEFSIQIRIVDENNGSPVAKYLDWQDAIISGEQFTITLDSIPAGGLYRIESRLRSPYGDEKRPRRGDCIHHIGVGDIYIIAGQSNASGTGKGEIYDPLQLGVHLFGNDENWKLATHPLEDATNTKHPITMHGMFHGHSPWIHFGKQLLKDTNIPVGLIPCALGGSPMSRWIHDDGTPAELMINMQDIVNKAGGKIKAIVWYQGESDTINDQENKYQETFTKFINLVRTEYSQPSLPFFIGQLHRSCDKDFMNHRAWTVIREAQRSISHNMSNVHLVCTFDLPLSDPIHNSSAANIILGERFANRALEHIHNKAIMSGFPDIKEISVPEDRRSIQLAFTNLSGDWIDANSKMIHEFKVADDDGFIQAESIEVHPDNTLTITLGRKVLKQATLHTHYGSYPPIPSLRDDSSRCLVASSIEFQ